MNTRKATIVPDKTCPICGKSFNRKVEANGKLTPLVIYAARKYCGRACSNVARARALVVERRLSHGAV